MLPNLSSIKNLRKKYTISQKELAQRANVSQSLIAKIESGKIEPSYTKAIQIFSTLDELRHTSGKTANDCMNPTIIFATPTDTVLKSITVMKQKGISQLPVKHENTIVGLVNETLLVDLMVENKKDLLSCAIIDIMQDAPPIVPGATTQKMVLELLKEHQMVLVSQHGKITGIISRADMLTQI